MKNSLLWVHNHHQWTNLFTADQSSVLTKVQQVSSMVQEEVEIFFNAVALAQLGKLNPNQVTTESIQSIIDFINLGTSSLKMVSPVHFDGNLITMPMSYVFPSSDQNK